MLGAQEDDKIGYPDLALQLDGSPHGCYTSLTTVSSKPLLRKAFKDWGSNPSLSAIDFV